jgi:ParB-like chromosome segregation protein Spo0J
MSMIKTADVVLDSAAQARAQISEQIVGEYAEAMRGGEEFPPIKVVFDGLYYFVADGFHRIKAAQLAGLTEIEADISDGGLREAVLIAAGANSSHGLRRTLEDRRKAVRMVLADEEWAQWSDVEVARICKVSRELVAKIRAQTGVTPASVRCNRGDKQFTIRPARRRRELHPAETSRMTDQTDFDQGAVELEECRAAAEFAFNQKEAAEDRLTAALAGGDDDAREEAAQTLAALRAELRQAEIARAAITSSRNSYQSENCELMQQIRNREQFIKKLKKRCTCGAFDG